jgi:hypothetical protein
MYGGEEECVWDFSGKARRKGTGRIILKCILER